LPDKYFSIPIQVYIFVRKKNPFLCGDLEGTRKYRGEKQSKQAESSTCRPMNAKPNGHGTARAKLGIMCISAHTSYETSGCSGNCSSCSLMEPGHLEQKASPKVALTALRVFVLPFLTGAALAAIAAEVPGLQLPAGLFGFAAATSITRRVGGGRLL
jgi:hypothetical protein